MNRFDLLSMPLRSVPALTSRARLVLALSAALGLSVMLRFSVNAQALTNAETKISGMQGSATNTIATNTIVTNTIVTQRADSQPSESQAKLAAFAEQLKLEYQLINNTQGRDCLTADNSVPSAQTSETAPKLSCFNAQLFITSTADYSGDVSIFFSHIRPISRVLTPLFTIKRIQGDLHQLQATPQFQGFKAGDTVTIPFVAELWQLAESDAMPNYYLVQAGLAPEVIHSTQLQLEAETGMEIRPFVNAYDNAQLQFKSSATDEVTWVTPQSIFAENQDTPRNEAGVSSQIIPTPTAVQLIKAPPLSLASGLKIQGYANSNKIAMESALTYLASLGMTQSSSGVSLALSLDPSLGIEAYRLAINDAGIAIVGGSDTGVFYGLMSLVSVYDINTQSVAQLTVVDAPRYSFRGFHLDVARNFHGVAQIEKLLEQMAAFKLNKLHLHMADDEGWRLAIAGLPELTDVGAKRCHDLTEKTCLLPQLGSGPNADSSVNGYYSREQYIHLVKFAAARHIQIIPSMDMPGHSRAAIKAMDARSARLAPAIANQYQLSDPQDKTQYSSIQHYNDNTINVCLESSFAFIDKVINEIALMHQEAGAALTRYHIGADETAGAWLKSPACAAFIANNPYGVTDLNQLGGYFIERISQMLAQKGIEVAGWSDGMSHTRIENMPTIVQSNVWDSLHAGGHKRAHQQANLGWDVVLSVPDVLYFDMPHAADPKEHGYYWATRASSSRKVFEFMPGNLAANAEQWLNFEGRPYVADDSIIRTDTGLEVGLDTSTHSNTHAAPVTMGQAPLAQGREVLGIQGQLWSETVRSNQLVDYLTFPRLLMLAERAWHSPEWEVPYLPQGAIYNENSEYFTPLMQAQQLAQWQRLANTLGQKALVKLDKAKVEYRVPLAGAKIQDGLLHMNTSFPGLGLEYREMNGQWQRWSHGVKVTLPVAVRARSADDKRAGRMLILRDSS